MKIKAKTYKGKRIVMGDKNLVTKNEIHVNDIPGNDEYIDDGMEYYKVNTKIILDLFEGDALDTFNTFFITSIVDGNLIKGSTIDEGFVYMCGNAKVVLYGNVTAKSHFNTQLEECGISLNNTSIFKPITAKEYYSLINN